MMFGPHYGSACSWCGGSQVLSCPHVDLDGFIAAFVDWEDEVHRWNWIQVRWDLEGDYPGPTWAEVYGDGA